MIRLEGNSLNEKKGNFEEEGYKGQRELGSNQS